MLNHITLRVNDLEKSKKFFLAALGPLGYKLFVEKEKSAGFGQADIEGNRDFWIKEGEVGETKSFYCLAFTAPNKEGVENFYRAALEAGGVDNGAPGYRPQYHAGYYAAFVLGPDGYNIEAVFDDWEKLRTVAK
ncbi:MAG: VOC family protein [Candidatus Berkelbacteria bacterium]|nr:VOC family protein [Candidatus Berkelbacteria bacterium]